MRRIGGVVVGVREGATEFCGRGAVSEASPMRILGTGVILNPNIVKHRAKKDRQSGTRDPHGETTQLRCNLL